jgi:hypothetical protein
MPAGCSWSSLAAAIGVPLVAIALVLEVFGCGALACAMTYVMPLRITVYGSQRMATAPES